uniref:Uncharacterized protein n=1 Tax=Populus trichocarpa TaxID=3694 RepID=A0A2K1X495_POPTR
MFCMMRYQRSTTAISAVAPICYAHLAASQLTQFIKFDDLSYTSSSHVGLLLQMLYQFQNCPVCIIISTVQCFPLRICLAFRSSGDEVGPVAQRIRARGYEPWCQGFESLLAHNRPKREGPFPLEVGKS